MIVSFFNWEGGVSLYCRGVVGPALPWRLSPCAAERLGQRVADDV